MRRFFWDFFFLLLYIAILFYGIEYLLGTRLLAQWVPFGDVVLMALAIQRLIQFFTNDPFLQGVRDWFTSSDRTSLRGTLGALISCQWCVGLWAALIISFSYFATPYAWYVILILALASLGSFLQMLVNALSFYSESKK